MGLWTDGRLLDAIQVSVTRVLVGFVLGAVVGVGLAVVAGLSRLGEDVVDAPMQMLRTLPHFGLLPLFILWFGIDEPSKYALIALGTFTPTVTSTYGAVDNVDRTLIRMGQSFGLSWWSIVSKIVLPGALPGILSGLRVSLAIGIILLVAAEMLGAEYGIGAYVLQAGALYDLERLFAGVVILSVIGVLVSWLIGLAEKRLLRWRG